MDCSSTGWLRSVVCLSNGLSKEGSTFSDRSPKQAATITAKTTPKKIRTRATMLFCGGSGSGETAGGDSSGTDGYSRVGSSTSGDWAIPTRYEGGTTPASAQPAKALKPVNFSPITSWWISEV